MALPAGPRADGWARRTARVVLALVAAGSFFGCSGGFSQGPSDTLRAYARALEAKDVDGAYRLLSDEARRSISLEAFRRMVLENPEDVTEVARALARPAGDPSVRATVALPNGDELVLLFEDGRWRIDAAAIDLYGQGSPRQALVGFLRALERKRYDVILRYVPDAEREGLPGVASLPAPAAGKSSGESPSSAPPVPGEPDDGALTAEKLRREWEGPQRAEMQRIAQALKAALPTATIEESGEVASMAYGSGGTVSFLKEHGVWKIRDF